MSNIVKVEVPDIGDFKDVDIIEVLVEPGSVIAVEDALITLESDKATIEIPSPSAGTVKDVLVKVNEKVSQGSVILTLEISDTATTSTPAKTPAAEQKKLKHPPNKNRHPLQQPYPMVAINMPKSWYSVPAPVVTLLRSALPTSAKASS